MFAQLFPRYLDAHEENPTSHGEPFLLMREDAELRLRSVQS